LQLKSHTLSLSLSLSLAVTATNHPNHLSHSLLSSPSRWRDISSLPLACSDRRPPRLGRFVAEAEIGKDTPIRYFTSPHSLSLSLSSTCNFAQQVRSQYSAQRLSLPQ